MTEPDRYSNEWYRQQFSGITHLQRLLASNQEDDQKTIKELKERVAVLEARSAEDAAKIGELQEWRAKVVEWLKKREGKA